jgi:VCBS repeat-containing protein
MLDVSADQGTFSRIRLVIADRQPIVLHGLKSVFTAQRDFKIVASCSTGTSCLEAIRNLAPDVALLADTLPDLPVSKILDIARAENLSTRLVFFTESESGDDLTAAIAAGACSEISKYASPDTMLRSLRLMTERVSASLGQSHDLSADGKKVDGVKIENMLGMLTHRERQIARLVCDGLSNKEIARELNVSRGTVKVHLHNIFQKLEISNRTVLATIASLQRSAGFSTLALAALGFGILSDAKASTTNDTDEDGTAHKDLEHSVFELWKKAILRHIIVADPGETVVLTQRGSPIKISQITHSTARMEEVHAADQAGLSNLARGYGPIGSGTPYFFVSPLQQAINNSQTSIMAPQQFPPIEFASNLTKGHGGSGTFIMTAAGVWAYTLDNSNAATQALDPGQTLIDTSKVATMDGTTQVATITIHGPSNVDGNDVDNLAPGPVVHDSHPPLAFGILGHDSVTAQGNAVQVVCGGAGDDTLNGTGVVNVIYRGSGNDTIEGNGGDDTIHGGSCSDTVNGNDGNDIIVGGFGGDQLTGSTGDDIFVYLSAIDSNSTQFDTISDFASGTDKINLAALGALAFLHLTSTSTSVPPHTLAWIYNPTSNETIIYVNPTDGSLHIGDPGLLEIHLQGVVSVAESDFVYEPDAAAVAAALHGIDPALLVATAIDGTAGSAHASVEAEASESTLGTAGAWTMPSDDGLRFHFGRDRISSLVSTRVPSSSNDWSYASVKNNDGTLTASVHVSSIERGDAPGNSAGHGNSQQAANSTSANASGVAELTEPGITPGHSNSQHPSHSASASATGAAEPVETADAPGNSAGHGNAEHASNSAAVKVSAANEPTEPGVTSGHGHSHPPQSASARAMGTAEPVETADPPGNSAGHGNAEHASNSAVAKASAANEPTEPGVTSGHGHSHPPHSASASAMEAAEPVETADAPGNSAGHGNAKHASNSAAVKVSAANEPTEPGVTSGHGHSHPPHLVSANAMGAAEPVETADAPGNSAGHRNAEHASNSAAANASAANEPTESGVTPGQSHSHPSHPASASAMGAAEPVETADAHGNSAGHGNAQHASSSAAANASAANEPTEPGVTLGHSNSEHSAQSASASATGAAEPVGSGNAPGHSAGHGNAQHASNSAAASASAAAQPVEFASWTGGAGHEPAFHFKNQGDPPTSIEAVEVEQLNDRPVFPGHAGGLAAIPQVGPAAMEQHAASNVDNAQHHALGHSPHELLI